MGVVKPIDIKNLILLLFLQRHYWYQKFWFNLIKDWQKTKNIDIYSIGYNTIKKNDDCENINSTNQLYLLIDHANGYIEEKGVIKYLIFGSTDENTELLKKYNDVFNGIRDKIEEISSSDFDYEKDCMKIKFNSDDNLPLNIPLKLDKMTITIRSILEEDGKLYARMLEWDRIDISGGVDAKKTSFSEEYDIFHYWKSYEF